MYEYFKIATLDIDSIQKITTLEKRLGKHIMAFESGIRLAELTEAEIDEVSALEKELGVLMLVYNKLNG
jgi:hypothetical protein